MIKKIAVISLLLLWLFTRLEWSDVNAAAPIPEAWPQLSCIDPLPEQAQACAEQVQRILDSTVRIEMHGWIESNGERTPMRGRSSHATIKDGRYLVTHNHFKYPLRAAEQSNYTAISLYRANGDLILEEAPLTTFNVVVEGAEMLILEFTDGAGQGLFESMGLPSASFKSWSAVGLQPGAEVAQISWNGRNTFVQWTTIQKVITDDGSPHLDLHSLLRSGSSGGGVFWQGQHVGNNLSRTLVRNKQKQITRYFSTAALNDMPPESTFCSYFDFCRPNPWAEKVASPTLFWQMQMVIPR